MELSQQELNSVLQPALALLRLCQDYIAVQLGGASLDYALHHWEKNYGKITSNHALKIVSNYAPNISINIVVTLWTVVVSLKMMKINMNITQFIPLFLLAIPLTAADKQPPPSSIPLEEITPLATSFTPTEGAGTVQRMDLCEQVSKSFHKHPSATMYTSAGWLLGTTATVLKLSAPSSACGSGFIVSFSSTGSLFCFLGLCATPPGERLRNEHIRPCIQNFCQWCEKNCLDDGWD